MWRFVLNILFIYPDFPDTFWSLKYAIKFISKKSAYPPLGLLTVAAMLPSEWDKKLVDMNVEKLRTSHLQWADLVFISAMSLQLESVRSIVSRCRKAGVRTVAGGPLFSAWPEKFEDVDYLVLGEAELTLPLFLKDFEAGNPSHIYSSEEHADISKTPIPLWDLINIKKYSTMNIQFSRGCPFNCEFCEIVVLYGHEVRLKSTAQIIEELDSLYDIGWRSGVFFVDDNFIGNKARLKKDVLPALIEWSKKNGHPFTFHTEASIDLADDEELMRQMTQAGFDMVFIGIETPHQESLTECNKNQNKNRDLLECIDRIQGAGLQVQGGFILGFDNDPDTIFDTVIRFIQDSKIIVAMVGLLNAPRGTRLFKRLQKERRITSDISGNNTDYSMNFLPKMNYDKLASGYKKVLNTIYSPEYYYNRIIQHIDRFNKTKGKKSNIHINEIVAFIKSIFLLGIFGKERRWYWKLMFHTLFQYPTQIPTALTYAICGYHFRKIYKI